MDSVGLRELRQQASEIVRSRNPRNLYGLEELVDVVTV